ncbi:CIC11C00000004107 [Sungouiella intermedia]|uniref:CIC11C00000004107 n=1 Tax=Sungouiella intermedia TaxID=45354 RepID=A0A1L0C7P9_9ASCO|nr:CIC11C00000004107 [[Candida] intermedia]
MWKSTTSLAFSSRTATFATKASNSAATIGLARYSTVRTFKNSITRNSIAKSLAISPRTSRLFSSMADLPKTQYGWKYDKSINNLKLVEDLKVPTPSATQVVVKIEAAGLCHSDLHVLEGLDVGDDYVMGHEIFGHIVLTGDDVTNYSVGDRVAAFGPGACGECELCRTGHDNDCTNTSGKWFGLGFDGGYQQYLLVKNPRNLVKVPDSVSDVAAAAVITDAMLTPYHAIKLAGLDPSKKVLFIGAGGLGSTAVQIGKLFGAHITVLERKESARELVKLFGADEVYESLPEDTPLGTFDACLDFVSLQQTFEICQKYIKSHGIIIPVGLGAPALSFNLADLALREVKIIGSFWGTSNELAECYRIAGKGLIHPKTTKVSLKELPAAFEKLKKGEVSGRLVLIP